MNPTPAAITLLRGQVSDWSPSDAELAAALNGTLVANPTPAEQVPAPLDALALLPLLSAESLGKLEAAGLIIPINTAIGEGQRVVVGRWVQYAAYRGHVTEEEAQALAAAIAATVDDPDWQAELPWPVVHLGRLVDAEDLAAAREAGE